MRELASVQKILNIEPINGVDFIEVATILEWKIVVRKNEFKIGELVIYFEVDSLLPELPHFEFLRTSSWNEKEKSFRIKTKKLRGQISQGLIIPLSVYSLEDLAEGTPLTEKLGVRKYEPFIPVELEDEAKAFTWPITKTDETRLQTIPDVLKKLYGKPYYISSKLDGTSSSFLYWYNKEDENDFFVCGHTYCYLNKKENTFYKMAEKYNIREKLEDYFNKTRIHIAIQSELVGQGIQKNKLKIAEHEIFIFNLVNIDTRTVLSFDELKDFCYNYSLPMVPVIEEGESFPYTTVEEMLKLAEGYYKKDGFKNAMEKQRREGIVVRSKDSTVSFKVLSNNYLLENDE
jgi:RNA ligase (TIGR02306 family)